MRLQSSPKTATSRQIPGTTATVDRFSRRCIILSAARPKCLVRRFFACAGRISEKYVITMGSLRRGQLPMRNWSRITPKPSRCTTFTGYGGRIQLSPPPVARIRVRHSPTNRVSSNCSTILPRPATIHSRRPARSCWTRATWRTAPASGAKPAMAFPAWCTPNPMQKLLRCDRPSSSRM